MKIVANLEILTDFGWLIQYFTWRTSWGAETNGSRVLCMGVFHSQTINFFTQISLYIFMLFHLIKNVLCHKNYIFHFYPNYPWLFQMTDIKSPRKLFLLPHNMLAWRRNKYAIYAYTHGPVTGSGPSVKPLKYDVAPYWLS